MIRFEIVATFRNPGNDTDPFRHEFFNVYSDCTANAVAVVADLTRDDGGRVAVTVHPTND